MGSQVMTQVSPTACPSCRAELRVVTGPKPVTPFTVCTNCIAILRRTDDGALCVAVPIDFRGLSVQQFAQLAIAQNVVRVWHARGRPRG